MKKTIGIIVLVVIIIGGGYSIYSHASAKENFNLEVLNQSKITNYNSKTKEFLNTIIDNNYKNYKELCDDKMGTEEAWNKVQSSISKEIKNTTNLRYIETEKKDELTVNIYKLEDSNIVKTISVTFDKEDKVAGFYILNSTSKEDIKNYNKVTNKFINAIQTKNYNEYKAICTEQMGADKNFEKVENIMSSELGNNKDFKYIKTVKDKGATTNYYKGEFEKKVVNFKISIDATGKVEGFFIG